MTERGNSRIRLTSGWSFSDLVIFVLTLTLLGPLVLPDYFAGSEAALIFLLAFPLVTGIAWYTALRNARGGSMTPPLAFLSALGVSVIAFLAGYADAFGLVPAIVGVVMGVGTVGGLSLLRALAVVPLVIVQVVGAIQQPMII